jgi:hypothetical protein
MNSRHEQPEARLLSPRGGEPDDSSPVPATDRDAPAKDRKPGADEPRVPPIEEERGPRVPDVLPGKPESPMRL